MEKATYRILTRTGTPSVDGYVFWLDGLRFGVSRYRAVIGVSDPIKSNTWTVTELTSGKAFVFACNCTTRDKAIANLWHTMDRHFKEILTIANQGIEDLNPGIIPKHEILHI